VFLIRSMSAPASPSLTDRTPISFEEFRDAWAAEETRKGLVGLMQRAILRLLTALVAILAEARADRLAAEAAGAEGVPWAADAEPAAAGVCVADADCGMDRRVGPRVEPADGNDDKELMHEGNWCCADLTRASEEKPTLAASSVHGGLPRAEDAGVTGSAEQTPGAAANLHPPASRAPPPRSSRRQGCPQGASGKGAGPALTIRRKRGGDFQHAIGDGSRSGLRCKNPVSGRRHSCDHIVTISQQ
jgi:hypothetical protein